MYIVYDLFDKYLILADLIHVNLSHDAYCNVEVIIEWLIYQNLSSGFCYSVMYIYIHDLDAIYF